MRWCASTSACSRWTRSSSIFTPAALDAAADLAMSRETGARGLRSIIESVLLDVMYEIPSRPEVRHVVVDDATIRGEAPAQAARRLGARPRPAARPRSIPSCLNPGPLTLPYPRRPVATFSVVAWDASLPAWGIAVASKFPAVGAVVPWARAGAGAVATQSYANTTYGPEGLQRMSAGESAAQALQALLDDDPGREQRQAGFVDRRRRRRHFHRVRVSGVGRRMDRRRRRHPGQHPGRTAGRRGDGAGLRCARRGPGPPPRWRHCSPATGPGAIDADGKVRRCSSYARAAAMPATTTAGSTIASMTTRIRSRAWRSCSSCTSCTSARARPKTASSSPDRSWWNCFNSPADSVITRGRTRWV